MLSYYLFYDPRYDTIDLETFINKSKPEVYAIGFYIRYIQDALRLFYVDKMKQDRRKSGSIELVLEAINTILTSKSEKIIWSVQNFGHSDATFIIHAIVEANKRCLKKGEVYQIGTTFRDDRVIKFSIKKGRYTMYIVDSYGILGLSLYDLCETSKTNKFIFPSEFLRNKK